MQIVIVVEEYLCRAIKTGVTMHLRKYQSCIAIKGALSHSCGVSLAIWGHAVLPATRHK